MCRFCHQFFKQKTTALTVTRKPTFLVLETPFLSPFNEQISIQLYVMYYECETWSVALREGRTLREQELRRIFVPNRHEAIGGCTNI
jgi:hypothetical protein